MVPRNTDNRWTCDALQRGDADAIRDKVRKDSSYIHERDFLGDTPLLSAITFADLELVRFLLKHEADPNVEVDDGYTCLLSAIDSDADESTPIVVELIRAGADIYAIGINGWTPLHMAAARGHVEKARILIDAGADVNRRKEIDGLETPLMEAAFSGQPAMVRLLLAHDADPSMRDIIYNRTALEIAEIAAKGPDPDVVNYLKNDIVQIDIGGILGDMELPADQMEMLKQLMKDVDIAQSYIDRSNEVAKTGNHAEVSRILTEHRR